MSTETTPEDPADELPFLKKCLGNGNQDILSRQVLKRELLQRHPFGTAFMAIACAYGLGTGNKTWTVLSIAGFVLEIMRSNQEAEEWNVKRHFLNWDKINEAALRHGLISSIPEKKE